jgi:zinc/manganese transport system substrate-binding protein
MQRTRKVVLSVILAAALVTVVAVAALESTPPAAANSTVIPVVAGENFWGSLISQLGGTHVSVTSIVTDPNSDPHEYEANASDARLVADARLVVQNGEGYDDWLTQLISASNSPGQLVLNVQSVLGVSGGGNPHFWYSPTYVNDTVAAMYTDLVSISPANTAYFQQQYAALNLSLGATYGRIGEIKDQFAGTQVASTEDIFVYLANATGLDLISPPDFMQAVAEGNDPPTQSVVEFQNQLESGNVSVLVYNEQTVTPITSQMKEIAAQYNVTVIGVTETIQPPDTTFQLWMTSELLSLQNALNPTLGH